MRNVSGWALSLAFLSISWTALGETTQVTQNHEQQATTPETPAATSASGAIPATSPQATPAPAIGRQLQIKGALIEATKAAKPEDRTRLFTLLATPPRNPAEVEAQKKAAKEFIDALPKETVSDQQKEALKAQVGQLGEQNQPTGEEIRAAAADLLPVVNGNNAALAAVTPQGTPAASPAAAAGATSDPSKQGDPSKQPQDPQKAALDAFNKTIADLSKQVGDLRNNQGLGENQALADQLADLANQNKGNENKGSGSGTGSGTPSDSSKQASTPTESTAPESKKETDHNANKTADKKEEKKDLPPLFGSSSSGSDKEKQTASNDKQNDNGDKDKKEGESLFSSEELQKIASATPAPSPEASPKAQKQDAADAFADGGVAGVGANPGGGVKTGLPTGESNIPQVMPNVANAASNDFNFNGDSGSNPFAGNTGNPNTGGPTVATEFPNGVGNEGGGYGGGKMAFNYDKGQGVYKGGGGATGGGPGDGEESVDGGGATAESASPIASAIAYAKKLAADVNRVLTKPKSTEMTIASRPTVFGKTEIAKLFVDVKSKSKRAAVNAQVPSADALALGASRQGSLTSNETQIQ